MGQNLIGIFLEKRGEIAQFVCLTEKKIEIHRPLCYNSGYQQRR